MKALKLFVISVFLIGLASCGKPILFYVEYNNIEKPQIELNFPEDWENGSKEESDVLVSFVENWGDPKKINFLNDSIFASKIVSEEFYAVSNNYLSTQNNVSFIKDKDDVIQKAEKLSSISLPKKALSCDDKFPGDNGYELVKSCVLNAEINSNKKINKKKLEQIKTNIANLFETIPENNELNALSWLGSVGDVMPGQTSSKMLIEDGPEVVFRDLLPIMRAQDLLVGNLETAITKRGTEWPKTFRFRMPKEALPVLLDSGFDMFSIANNHVYDYTEVGFSDTIAALHEYNVPFTGAGMDFAEAIKPYETKLGDTKVTIFSIANFPIERTGFYGLKHASIQRGKPGLLWADDKAVEEIITYANNKNDGEIVIVCCHAGLEYNYNPYEKQITLYHKFIENGVDLILGHHPHVLQPMEWYEGKNHSGLILYSQGNFLFDNIEDLAIGMDSMLFSFGILDGKIRAMRLYELRMDGYTTNLVTDGSINKLMNELNINWNNK